MTLTLAITAAAPAPLAYAFGLGLVGAVNPCGFPLLPGYLATFAGAGTEAGTLRRTARGLAAGASVTAGFVLVFGVLGLLIESGVDVVEGWVPWVMIALAAAMTVLGVLSALGRQVHLRVPAVRRSGSSRAIGMVGFGVAYAIGSLSCALPVFLAGVAGSFTRLGFFVGASTFVAYALGMGLLLVALSLVVAHAGAPALRRIRPLTRFVPRVAGLVLIVVGLYLLLYWVSDLVAPTSTPAPVRVVEGAQSALSGWLAGSPRLIGVVLGAVVVIALVLVAVALWRAGGDVADGRRRRPSSDPAARRRDEEPVGAVR
ncbi:MAG: cytochrome c biogenesis CcdA family protein [Acidimicrobiales bacterium]